MPGEPGASAGLQTGHEQLLSIVPAFLHIYIAASEVQETVFRGPLSVHTVAERL